MGAQAVLLSLHKENEMKMRGAHGQALESEQHRRRLMYQSAAAFSRCA